MTRSSGFSQGYTFGSGSQTGLRASSLNLKPVVFGEADPSMTLFVSPSWNSETNPFTHFTTVSSALIQANLLGPTSTNPVQIIINNGTYTEDLILISNVYLTGTSYNTIINGNVTWSPKSNFEENIVLERIIFSGNFTYDSSNKTNLTVASSLGITYCTIGKDDYTNTVLFNMRVSQDHSDIYDQVSIMNGSTIHSSVQTNNGQLLAYSSLLNNSLQFVNSYSITMQSVQVYNEILLNNSFLYAVGSLIGEVISTNYSYAILFSCNNYGIKAITQSVLVANNSLMTEVQVDATSVANVLNSSYYALESTGGGIDRNMETGNITTTELTTTVTLSIPYTDNKYVVLFTSNLANFPTVTNQVASSFIFTASAVGTYQYTILRNTSNVEY
jgi:hypothetical protein